jgi:hypothetical protein
MASPVAVIELKTPSGHAVGTDAAQNRGNGKPAEPPTQPGAMLRGYRGRPNPDTAPVKVELRLYQSSHLH